MRSIRERLSVASGGPAPTERGGSAERSQRGGSGAPSSSRNAAYSTDLAVKLQRIHTVLRPDIEAVKNRRRAQGRWSGTVSGAEYAAECGADKWVDLHSTGLPFNQLLDVKMLFEEKGGFAEGEFLRCFAPVFCPTKDAASVKLWYLHMDQDANGSVGWDEFSEHLLMTHHADEAEAPLMYVPRAIEPESTPLAQSMVTRVVANEALGEYYTAHVDGGVRAWDAALLTEKATVHHGEGSLVHTLVYLPQGSRLVVGQYDRMVFIYHCFLKPVPCELGRKVSGYRLEKAFKGETLALNKPSFSRIMRTCEYDPESKIMENGGGESIAEQFVMHKGSGAKKGAKVAKHYIDVVLMDDLEQGAHSMVPMYHTMQSDRVSDPFLMGLDNGVVQAYNLSGKTSHKAEQGAAAHHHGGLLDAGSRIRSLARWTVHSGWVTHLLEAPQLQGFISSSSDGTVQVFDVHKEEGYIRMESDIGDGPGSGRGVTHFDYSTDKNLLCACGIARDAVVWNPKARQKMCKLGEHRAAICSVMFVDKYSQLLTLSEDKVLKIWDVRTFRCVQTLTDKTRRYPEDKYTAMTYDFSSDSVITCSSAPVAWREVNSHARIETGSAWHAQYEGHLTPVVACLYHERMGQLVTADQASVHVWDLSSGRRLGTWSPEGCAGGKVRLTALCFDSGSRRMLVGCDSGDVSLYSLDGRRLKTFEMDGPPQEVSCLLHVTSHEGQGHAAAHAVAGGFGPRLAVWHDHPIPHSGHGVAVGRSPHYLQTQSLHVYSMAFCPPNKLAVGTAAGSCVLYNLNNMSLLSVNLLAAAVPATPAPTHGPPPPAAATTAGAVLKALAGGGGPATWKAASQQGREVEGRLQGTASFRHFRASMQARLLTVTEALCYVSPEVVVTLQGDGDAVVWRVFEGHFLKPAARFPAAFAAGDVAYALAYSPGDRLAYVGDCEAVVSVFDLSACCAAQPAGARRRDSQPGAAAAAKASAGQQHHNGCGVKLQTCFNLQITGVITELQVLKDSPALVVAANDCSVSVVNRFTGQVQVRLGSQRQHAASWPKGLPQELSTPRHPLSIASQRNETLSVLGKHRFAVVFPDDVVNATPIDSLQSNHRVRSADSDSNSNSDDPPSPKKKTSPSTGGGAGNSNSNSRADAKGGSSPAGLPQLPRLSSRAASKAGAVEPPAQVQAQVQAQAVPAPSAAAQEAALLPRARTSLGGRQASLSSATSTGQQRRPSSATPSTPSVDNPAMYQRYLAKLEGRVPCLAQAGGCGVGGSGGGGSGGGATGGAPAAAQAGQHASGKLEAQLKDVQQRKKQKNSVRQFGYTTVRTLRGVVKPHFAAPRWKDQCACAQCKAQRLKDPQAQNAYFTALPPHFSL